MSLRTFGVLFLCLAIAYAGDTFFPLDKAGGVTYNLPMTWENNGRELIIRTETMCNGASWGRVYWNQTQNWVKIQVKSYGLPNFERLCYEYDPASPYNEWVYPCVDDGWWSLFVISNVENIPMTCYYDPTTTELLGTDYDHYGNVFTPANTIAIPCNAMSMITTSQFKATGDVTEVEFTFDYNDMRDDYGRRGSLLTTTPQFLNNPLGSLINLYTNWWQLEKELPVINFANIIDNLNNASASVRLFGFGYNLAPKPRPSIIQGRDQTMLGWFGAINGVPQINGLDIAACAARYMNISDSCRPFQLHNFYPLAGC